MKKIILIDGNSLMFRSFYATAYTGNLMQNKQGLYTNALFGFCNMLSKVLEEKYDAIFVAFDAGKATFRHQQYADYKGGRKPMPEEFKIQIPYIKKYLDLLNIKRFETLDYEADDLIASVATLARDSYEVKIITGDKDLLQLVGGNVKVYITRKGVGELEEFNEENFKEKMGINPLQLTDYKGLIGDSSDNLSGIKGIGPKSACALLEKYGTLENIIDHVDELKGKQVELIKEGAEVGLTCKKLATLVRDIDLEFGLSDLEKKDYNVSNLISFYEEVEFNSFIKKIKLDTKDEVSAAVKTIDYVKVDSATDFNNIDKCYLDLEVFGDIYYDATILGLAIIANGQNYFWDLKTQNESLVKMLEDKDVAKITFDFKKLYVCLNRAGINVAGLAYDLLLASYLANPSYANDDFKKVADHFLDNDIEYDEVVYGYKSKAKVPEEDIYISHALNKCLLMEEFKEAVNEKIKEFNQEELLKVEQDLSSVLGKMELDGLKVDTKRLHEIGIELEEKAKVLVSEIYEIAGEEFNINSVKQLGTILFEKLGLPHGKKNKTGYATGSEILEKLAVTYPIAQKILDYRAITKLTSTYINGLFDLVNDKGFIHPLYKQALTLTGRLSSINPNIQNMPIRTDLGKVIRDCFVSRFEGGKIFSSDYSQIELRVLAHMANDQVMIDLFNSNEDFHSSTAAQIYEVDKADVTPAMRRSAKAINFGIVYGMSAWGLSETLGISPIEANIYINKYFYRFSNVKVFLDKTVEDAKANGYTKTIMNRVRFIPELANSNKALVAFGERTAMNSPIQGSAADIIKVAMVNVAKCMKDFKSLLIAQVHDELVFDVYPGEEDSLAAMVKEQMESAVKLNVKLVAEGEIGHSWLKD
ncbi:MAG: DNA polymerase I [Bacilli bacterium]|nr:DNA polymerase I [Bacilli bacterium]